MKRGLLLGLGTLVLVGLTVSTLPARLLPLFINSEQLRLGGLSGTLLDGEAARALVKTPAGFIHLGRVVWTIDAFSLLTQAPKATVQSAWGAQRGELTVQRRGAKILVDDLDAAIDAKLLRTLAPLAVDGRLSLQFERLVFDGAEPREASGRFVWHNAIWRTKSREHALGTYVAQVSSADSAIRAAIDTLSGPVSARGTARLQGSRYDLEMMLASSEGRLAPEVERALRLFATPEEDGYLLRLDGDLAIAP